MSEKYYIVDPGFYYLFNDENKRDLGYLLENIVYLELRRHGYKVTIVNYMTLKWILYVKNLEKLHIFK